MPSVGGAVTQDESCPCLTHAIVPAAAPPGAGTKGMAASASSSGGAWASLPAPLQPGAAAVPVALLYVTQAWLTDSLRFQRRQPEREYRPPPAAPTAVAAATGTAAAPAAAGGAAARGSRRRSGGWSTDEGGSDKEEGGGGGGAGDVASLQRWLGPLWREECLEMEKAELMLQVGSGQG